IPTSPPLAAGLRADGPVSSPIAQVTRLAATAAPEPPLERPALRLVSYGLHVVPPNVLRSPEAYSPMLALARMIAPALRRRATISASAGGRSLAKSAAAPLVERMSKVSNWSLIANGMPCSGPLRRPVRAHAQRADEAADYPKRTVRIIVSAPPGGGLDIAARILADKLQPRWGHSGVVENRPGAGGNLGAGEVAGAEADGYTLLAAQPGPLTTSMVLYKKLHFDPTALEPVMIMTRLPNTLVVRADFPANTVAELIAYAKANPGKVNFGSQGVGTTPHLTGELFARITGTQLVHVPYRGTAQAVNDLVAGHLDMLFFQLDSVREQYQAKKAKMLAVTTGERVGAVPEVPTMSEAGVGADPCEAQPRHQRGAQESRNGGAAAQHEHDAGRRHTRRDQKIHQGRDRALGRRDPVGENQAAAVASASR